MVYAWSCLRQHKLRRRTLFSAGERAQAWLHRAELCFLTSSKCNLFYFFLYIFFFKGAVAHGLFYSSLGVAGRKPGDKKGQVTTILAQDYCVQPSSAAPATTLGGSVTQTEEAGFGLRRI